MPTLSDKPPLEPIPEKVVRRLRDAARREAKGYVLRVFASSMCRQIAFFVILSVLFYVAMDLLMKIDFDLATPFALGAAFALSSGLLIWDSVKRERLRREKREYCPDGRMPICLNCEYDLRGTGTDQCPECGEAVFVFKKVR